MSGLRSDVSICSMASFSGSIALHRPRQPWPFRGPAAPLGTAPAARRGAASLLRCRPQGLPLWARRRRSGRTAGRRNGAGRGNEDRCGERGRGSGQDMHGACQTAESAGIVACSPTQSPHASRRASRSARRPALTAGAGCAMPVRSHSFRDTVPPRTCTGAITRACHRQRRMAGRRDVDEFLVLPGHVGGLDPAVHARARDPAREMAPVGRAERTGQRMRARRHQMRASGDQPVAHRQDPRPSRRRARFDDDDGVAGGLPEPIDQRADRRRHAIRPAHRPA